MSGGKPFAFARERRPGGRRHERGPDPARRLMLVAGILVLASLGLVARAFDLQVVQKRFYQQQGDARFQREMEIKVSRGTIFDRNGEPLAVSTPVMSIWANPPEVLANPDRIPQLAKALGVDPGELKQKLADHADKEFVYLRRQMQPELAQAILDMDVPGIYGQREYKRYYPSGEVTAHVLGFTNVDDHGQEGLELAFDDWLAGKPGEKQVIRDRQGHIVQDVRLLRAPQPGKSLTITIDRRIQFLAYNALKQAVEKSDADSGSMVVEDVRTGEVLAMVNLPTYNPNAVQDSQPAARRNRAVTDVVEPGSTIKPILMAAALSSGQYTPFKPTIDTTGGHWYFYGHDIHDTHDYGVLTPTAVITKSSNVGAAHIAMSLSTKLMYDTYRAFGLGSSTESGFPGESSGYLKVSRDWRPLEKAIMGYGYGLNVTVLQMANAYATLADGGVMHSPTFVKGEDNPGRAIIEPRIAREILNMMETVTAPGGTAPPAEVANYIVAGKTGTAHKADAGGYSKNSYTAAFGGIIPATDPRLVAFIVIDNPRKGSYYGAYVSGPVFAQVMEGAMRLLDVPPDNIGRMYAGGPLINQRGLAGDHADDKQAPAEATPVDEAPDDSTP